MFQKNTKQNNLKKANLFSLFSSLGLYISCTKTYNVTTFKRNEIIETLMKHTVHTLTREVLIEMFGDQGDWYSVLKNGNRVGSYADLRKKVLKNQELADKAERRKMFAQLAKEDNLRVTKEFFESRIKNGEVFYNRTQPNVHINGCKCYIICSSSEKIRLGIMHDHLTFDEMQQLAGIEGKPNASKRRILFDNLTLDEAANLIELLCN